MIASRPANGWEPLDESLPDRLIDRHPNGDLVALQITSSPVSRAAIWDANTGRLYWAPEHTIALCWTHGGHQIVLVREAYTLDPNHPRKVASPLQSEYEYLLERRVWPERNLVSCCPIQPPTGWLDSLAVSPRGDLAAIVWSEQDRAGFFLVALDAVEGDRQLSNASYQTAPNLITGPRFSPDGENLVLSCSLAFWWAAEHEDPSAPARGGIYMLGHVTVYSVAGLSYRELPVIAEVPTGWLPADPDNQESELLGEPIFLTNSEFTITLPTGAEQRFHT